LVDGLGISLRGARGVSLQRQHCFLGFVEVFFKHLCVMIDSVSQMRISTNFLSSLILLSVILYSVQPIRLIFQDMAVASVC
jgi:hypothetical protein